MLTNSRIIKAAAKGVLTRARIIGGGANVGAFKCQTPLTTVAFRVLSRASSDKKSC